MRKSLFTLIAFVLLGIPKAEAQFPRIFSAAAAKTGGCTILQLWIGTDDPAFYYCDPVAGEWKKLIPSGSTVALGDLPTGTANQYLKTNAGETSLEHVTLSVGTAGTDFAIAHGVGTTIFNLPDASATNRGALLSADWTIFNNKSDLTADATLNTIQKGDGTNLVNSQITDSGSLITLPGAVTFSSVGAITIPDTTTSTTGVIYKGADRFVHNFHHPTGDSAVPLGQNTFVGVTAGNLTMGSTATSTSHGSLNSVLGFQAFFNNTLGYYNAAFGVNSLYTNTTGYENAVFGALSLFSNTTGYENAALGLSALFSNTTGFSNSALGREAGRFIADGSTPNQTSNTSVYLGNLTKANADGDANEIVIGYNAIGAGSNTAVLGNSSVTKVYLGSSAGTSLLQTQRVDTATNCSDSAGDAACVAASAGSVVIDAADTNTVVSTTAVTANSQIFIMEDSSLGTRLSVTCNTTTGRLYTITARTAGTSFTITASAAPTTNPACLSYWVVN